MSEFPPQGKGPSAIIVIVTVVLFAISLCWLAYQMWTLPGGLLP